MMPPGHVAVTWGVATLFQANNSRLARLDYRLLALSAMAADIIDKPLALLVFTEAQTSQLIGHSLLPNLLVLVAALLVSRRLLPYVLAANLHLVADRMWNHTESFWWPLYGWDVFWQFKPMNSPETMLNVYLDIITRYPQVWVIEILAVVYLVWFTVRHRLYLWSGLKRFLITGNLPSFSSGTNRTSKRLSPQPQQSRSDHIKL